MDKEHGKSEHANHEKKTAHGNHDHHDHMNHHARMVADFRKRFWISLIITIPILILSPPIQEFFGFGDVIRFIGDLYVLFGLSSIVFIYGLSMNL